VVSEGSTKVVFNYPLEEECVKNQKEHSLAGQKNTRRQKDISRLLREKKYIPAPRPKKDNTFPAKKSGRMKRSAIS